MIKSLIGENHFAVDAELKAMVHAYLKKFSDLGIERIDADEVSYARIEEALTSISFFTPDKLVILHSPSGNKDFVEKFEELINKIPESTTFVIVEQKLDKRLAFYKNLKKLTDCKEMNEPDINSLQSWLVQEAKVQGGSISRQDAVYLIERAGANQQKLSNELTKLLLYEPDISLEAIDILTERTPQGDIFQLLRAAFSGNKNRTMQLYNEQRTMGKEPASIIGLLTWQIRIIAIIISAGDRSIDQIARESKINPKSLRDSQTFARQHNLSDVRHLLSDLLQIDTSIKSSSRDADESLKLFLLKLSN
jgi:DNA polymerase-3 subunit delta